MVLCEYSGQLERIGRKTRDGRRRLHTDLDEPLDAKTARGLLDEEQVLGLDPSHRAGELPCQQLDDDLAHQLARLLVPPRVVVGEDLVERLGGHQIADLLNEVAVQRERPRHQVRDVLADDQIGIRVARHDALERAAEVGDAHAKHRRVERHVDAGHQDERPLAAADLATLLDLFLQHLQPADRAGDGVLRATQVEVHDLKKFAGALGDLVDESGDVGVVEIDLRRPNRGQPVVGPAEVVTRNDVVHLAAAVEHHLQQSLQLVNTADTGQRGVLADGVAAGQRTFDERTLFTHLGDLGGRHRRHRDLSELRQEQHAVGVVVMHTAGDQAGRVVPHHVQHREAQCVAGELVGGVPHLARSLGPGADLHAHALVLDALAGERIDGLRGGQLCRRRHHELVVDARGDLDDLCATVDSDSVDPEVDVIAGQDHAEESRRPADHAGRRGGLAVGCGDDVLGCR